MKRRGAFHRRISFLYIDLLAARPVRVITYPPVNYAPLQNYGEEGEMCLVYLGA